MATMVLNLFSAAVLSWAPVAGEVVKEMEVADVLAIIHIESTGEADARRPNSKYYGLLQISQDYLIDALDYRGQDLYPVSCLMGDGRSSLEVFVWYMKRYSFIHSWNPTLVALVHKTGPNVSQEIIQAAQSSSITLVQAASQSSIPAAASYLEKFEEFSQLYREVLSERS